jgi:hypothetical protein
MRSWRSASLTSTREGSQHWGGRRWGRCVSRPRDCDSADSWRLHTLHGQCSAGFATARGYGLPILIRIWESGEWQTGTAERLRGAQTLCLSRRGSATVIPGSALGATPCAGATERETSADTDRVFAPHRRSLSREHGSSRARALHPLDPICYPAAAISLARCRVVVLTSASRSPPLIPAMYFTSFLRDSMSYCVVIAICSMIGEPPPW